MRVPVSHWLYHLTSALRPICWLYWRFRFLGAEQVPKSGPALVVANHSSYLDPWYLCMLFPRKIRFLVTREWYFRSPAWEWYFSRHGTLPVQQTPEATLQLVRELLAAGEVVGVFPEGRISFDGRMQKFRSGIAYMAARSGAPVIPIGIRGAYEGLPRTRRIPRPVRITLRVGAPLRFPDAPRAERPTMREIARFRNRVSRSVRELAGQAEREAPAAAAAPPPPVVAPAPDRETA